MTTRIVLRRGTATQWTAANPTLAAGEIGVETNTGRKKVGNGTTAWNSLPYDDAAAAVAKSSADAAAAAASVALNKLDIDGTVTGYAGFTAVDRATLEYALASPWDLPVRVSGDIDLGAVGLGVPAGKIITGPGRLHGDVAGPMLSLTSGTRVEGVELENTSTSGSIVCNIIAGASDVRVSRATIKGRALTQGVTVNALGVDGVYVEGCSFDTLNYGVLTNEAAADLRDIQVRGCRFTNIYGDGIELNHPGAGGVGDTLPYETAHHFVISDNIISVPDGLGTSTNAGLGIGIAGTSYGTVANNVVVEARRQGIHIEDESRHITFTGNIVYDAIDGFHVLDGQYLTFTGNQAHDCSRYGFQLTYDGSGNSEGVENLIVVGNMASGCGSHGFEFSGNSLERQRIITSNLSVDNGGDGFWFNGGARGMVFADNIAFGNAGVGVRTTQAMLSARWGRNLMYGNAAGDWKLTGGRPMVLTARDARFSIAAPAGAHSDWSDCFPLGAAANGRVTVTAFLGASNFIVRTYTLAWDGTTFAETQVGNVASGAVGGITLQQSGGKLQARVFSASAGTYAVDVQFEGHLIQGA